MKNNKTTTTVKQIENYIEKNYETIKEYCEAGMENTIYFTVEDDKIDHCVLGMGTLPGEPIIASIICSDEAWDFDNDAHIEIISEMADNLILE
jgi:hypothetical protein